MHSDDTIKEMETEEMLVKNVSRRKLSKTTEGGGGGGSGVKRHSSDILVSGLISETGC